MISIFFQAKKSAIKDKKMVTVDKNLLFACSFFDLGHAGYFETKDLVCVSCPLVLD